jgi:hypothetical protein
MAYKKVSDGEKTGVRVNSRVRSGLNGSAVTDYLGMAVAMALVFSGFGANTS